jgi:phosphopantothenoylcysteine decarboxylase / phosphopantothenate---cysteine ligase
MSNFKVLFKITGSIAAYKSAVLISRLVQNGCEVKTVMSDYALRFVGATTFEALTGHPVYTDSFAPRQVMSHIDLVKWADLTILCPATANTINKMANGISDNLLTSLFLAHDFSKPYLVAPAMNTLMYDHPSTQVSLSRLSEWGIQVLPVAKGYLACGDTGSGKLLEPDEIYQYIMNALNVSQYTDNPKKILITSGGTRENIDDIRYISNVSTGKTGAALADYFLAHNHELTFIHSKGSAQPKNRCNRITYTSFNDLNEAIKKCLTVDNYDLVIHLAAVSDYYPASVSTGNISYDLPLKKKLDSSAETINISFKKHSKIVDLIKTYSKNKQLLLVAFKLTNGSEGSERIDAIRQLFENSDADHVVSNDFSDRTGEEIQTNFKLYNRQLETVFCQGVKDLAEELQKIITSEP